MPNVKRSNFRDMEQILVGDGDQALASGSLVGTGTSLNIASDQLGVLSWDADGTIAKGNFITAGTNSTQVAAIKLAQGTGASSNITAADIWEVGEKAYVDSGIIHRDLIRSVTSKLGKVGSYDSDVLTGFDTPVTGADYTAYVRLRSVRNDRDFGDNDNVLSAVVPAYDSFSGVDATDLVLQNLAAKINERSKLVYSGPGRGTGTEDVVCFAINTAGGNGQALGTITLNTAINIQSNNGQVSSIVADHQLVHTIAKWINESALTASSTIELIDLVNSAGEGLSATGTLTTTGNFTANDEVTIGANTYTFVASPSSAYDVDLGATAAISLSNLAAAINGTGTPGTEYAAGTVVHPTVTAVATATTLEITAITGGTGGNSIVLTEDTDGGGTWSVSGSGTLAGGTAGNVDALVVMGLDATRAAYFDDIKEVRTYVTTNLADGFRASGYDFTRSHAAGEQDVNTGFAWWVEDRERARLQTHTLQNQPHNGFFSEGFTYVDKDQPYYTSYIVDYYDYEDVLGGVRHTQPKQTIILLDAVVTTQTVAQALARIVAGNPAIPVATDDTTTTAALEASLGAWLDHAAANYSGHATKGDAATGAIFV